MSITKMQTKLAKSMSRVVWKVLHIYYLHNIDIKLIMLYTHKFSSISYRGNANRLKCQEHIGRYWIISIVGAMVPDGG